MLPIADSMIPKRFQYETYVLVIVLFVHMDI